MTDIAAYMMGEHYGERGWPLECNPHDPVKDAEANSSWANGCIRTRNERRLAGGELWDRIDDMPWYERQALTNHEKRAKQRSKGNSLLKTRRAAGLTKPHPVLTYPKTPENERKRAQGYAMGVNWVRKGFPLEANPFSAVHQSIEHTSFERGWKRDAPHVQAKGIKIAAIIDELHPRDQRVIEAYVCRKGWKSLLPFYQRKEPEP